MAIQSRSLAASRRPANRWLVLSNVAVGTFMATLDGSIANVALPTIASDLHAPISSVQWVLTSYLLAICATLPIIGKLSDQYGRSRIYGFAFLLFAVGSVLCGLSDSLGMLIAARVVQAIGASGIMSNGQAIVAETFTEGRGQALGIMGTVVSLGSLAGPGIGGLLIGAFNWESIFWINVPIGAVGFIASLYLLPKSGRSERRGAFDYTGSALFIVGILSLLYSVSNGQSWGWSSPALIAGIAVALAALAAFVLWERRTADPMLDLSLYRIRPFALGTAASMLSFVALFCSNVLMPFYMQNVLHYSAEKTGLLMMAYPLTMAVVAPLSGFLADRIGSRLLTTAGLTINAAGFALLNGLTASESHWTVALHLALFGLGSGLFQSPNNVSVMGSVPKNKLGTAGGLIALVRNMGMVFGIAVSVSVYTSVLGGKPDPASAPAQLGALHAAFWTATGISLLALALSTGRLVRKK